MWLTIISILFLILIYIGYLSLDTNNKEEPIPKLLVAISTGKLKQYQTKPGDSSLVTELRRRTNDITVQLDMF